MTSKPVSTNKGWRTILPDRGQERMATQTDFERPTALATSVAFILPKLMSGAAVNLDGVLMVGKIWQGWHFAGSSLSFRQDSLCGMLPARKHTTSVPLSRNKCMNVCMYVHPATSGPLSNNRGSNKCFLCPCSTSEKLPRTTFKHTRPEHHHQYQQHHQYHSDYLLPRR